jgi:hypothetical protein
MAKESKYGEKTKMVNYRIPLSLVPEINQMVKLRLLDAEKSVLTNADIFPFVPKEGKIFDSDVEKKSNPTDEVFKHSEVDDFEYQKPKAEIDPMKAKVKALQEMANTIKDNTSGITKKKFIIEDEYDCIEVTRGLPSAIDRMYYGTRTDVAFWDKDDASVYYVKWENKYYKFSNSGEFNRFVKNKNIK